MSNYTPLELTGDEILVHLILFSRNSRPRLLKTNIDRSKATQFCSDDRTHGKNWFIGFSADPCYLDTKYVKKLKDNGRFDDIYCELGIE